MCATGSGPASAGTPSCATGWRSGGVTGSLQHDDLHDANVFVADGRHRFFDWGDASVAHPFLSLLVPLRVAADALGVPNGDRVLLRLRDAYLEPWSAYGSPAELREQCRAGAAGGAAAAGDDLAAHPARRAPGRADRVAGRRPRLDRRVPRAPTLTGPPHGVGEMPRHRGSPARWRVRPDVPQRPVGVLDG